MTTLIEIATDNEVRQAWAEATEYFKGLQDWKVARWSDTHPEALGKADDEMWYEHKSGATIDVFDLQSDAWEVSNPAVIINDIFCNLDDAVDAATETAEDVVCLTIGVDTEAA